jgi:hypothetical protein
VLDQGDDQRIETSFCAVVKILIDGLGCAFSRLLTEEELKNLLYNSPSAA